MGNFSLAHVMILKQPQSPRPPLFEDEAYFIVIPPKQSPKNDDKIEKKKSLEMQNKTTMRDDYLSVRTAKTKTK